MSAIRSRDTKPEVYLRKKLFSLGYRYRKNVKNVIGHPDMYFAKYHAAVFVNGCFWHRHEGCKYAYMPKSRTEFWKEKFKKNIERDTKVREELNQKDIRQLIVWECTIRRMIKDKSIEEEVLAKIRQFLSDENSFLEI